MDRRLVRHDDVDVVRSQAGTVEHPADMPRHRLSGGLPDPLPVHDEGPFTRTHGEMVDSLAVTVDFGNEQSVGVRGSIHHDRPRAVSEEAGVAVPPIGNPRERVGADHDRASRLARPHELPGHHETEQEAAAHGRHIEGRQRREAELLLDDAGCRRRLPIWCGRGDDQQIDRRGVDSGVLDRCRRGGRGQIRCLLSPAGDPTFADAQPLFRPVRVDAGEAADGGIADDTLRQAGAGAGDADLESRRNHGDFFSHSHCLRV